MTMAHPFEPTSLLRASFYAHHQTFNLVITPALTARNFDRDSFITHFHEIYASTLFALLGLLQIQSAGNTTSPFQIHPVTTTACVFGIVAYYLASRARQRLPLYITQINMAMKIFGSIFLAFLVTLLLPDSWWHIKYILYVSLAVIELHQVVTVLYDRYLRRFMLILRRSWPPNSARRLLPLAYMDLRERNNA